MTDNSFKLFASSPSPGTGSTDSAPKDRSKSGIDVPHAVADERHDSAATHVHGHRHHSEVIINAAQASADEHQASSSSTPGPRLDAPKQDVIKGPWRLLRLLPRETRSIMGKMLEIDPKQRASLEAILSDPWVAHSAVCHQAEGGKAIHMGEHHHTLEPGTPVAPAKDHGQ